MKITFLGTGSPEPSPRRASSGYLVEVGGERLLLDVGGGVYDRLIQAGLGPTKVDRLFFSHLHSDHMMDYARLVHGGWDAGKGLLGSKPLAVFGPPPIGEIHQRLFGDQGVFAHDIAARVGFPGSQEIWVERGGSLPRPGPVVDLTEIEPGFEIETEAWKLTSISVPHAQPFLVCMAYRITDKATGTSVVYSGDAGLDQAFADFCAGADMLVHWCYRMGHEVFNEHVMKFSPAPADIAAMAQSRGVKQLALTHMRSSVDDLGHHAQALADAREHFAGPLVIAEDLGHWDGQFHNCTDVAD